MPEPTLESSATDKLARAVEFLRPKFLAPPRVVIILGTGLGALAQQVVQENVIPFERIPHFPVSTALGHEGKLIFGLLASVPVAVMQGRVHRYEGYSLGEITFPLRVLCSLGAKLLVATNASGGLNPRLKQGELLIVADHLNLLWRKPAFCGAANGESLGPVYDPHLIDQALVIARRENIRASRGVYAAVPGPNYETRAELRMLRRLGADAVGMSTVPEALVARALGMRVLAISTITNLCRPDLRQHVAGPQVVSAAAEVAPQVGRIIRGLLAE